MKSEPGASSVRRVRTLRNFLVSQTGEGLRQVGELRASFGFVRLFTCEHEAKIAHTPLFGRRNFWSGRSSEVLFKAKVGGGGP